MPALVATNYSVPVSPLAGTVLAGQLLLPNTSGSYVVATAANRALYGRSDGLAFASGDASNPVPMIQGGPIDASLSGLGIGSASWVRASSAGMLERSAVPSTGDDVVGWCETNGRVHLTFGVLTALMVNGGGSSVTPPTGTGIATVTGGVFDPSALTTSASLRTVISDTTGTGSLVFNNAPSFSAFDLKNAGATGPRYFFVGGAIVANRNITYPVLTADDVPVFQAFAQTLTNKTIAGASNTLSVRIANDVTGLGTGIATFLGTPSGANLATALTTGLPISKGGTNRTALGSSLQVLRTNAAATDTEWATVSGSGAPGGSSGQIQYNSAGAFAGATNTSIGTGWIGLGAVTAASGALRFLDIAAGANDLLVHREGANDRVFFTVDGTSFNYLWGHVAYNSQMVGPAITMTHSSTFKVQSGTLVHVKCSDSGGVEVGVPMVGSVTDSSPWGSVDGQAVITVAGSNITLSAAQYSTHIQKFTGSPAAARTITYPAPVDDAHSYTKILWAQQSVSSITITTGTGTTASIAINTDPGLFIFTPAGVRKAA